MSLFLHGFGIGGYRSFTGATQEITGLSRINVIIGENNSGKSNVTRFVRKVLHPLLSQVRGFQFNDMDRPLGTELARFTGSPILVTTDFLVEALTAGRPSKDTTASDVRWLLSFTRKAPEGFVWCWVPLESGSQWPAEYFAKKQVEQNSTNAQRVHKIWTEVTGSMGGILDSWLQEILNKMTNAARQKFDIELIPAVRRLASRMPEFAEEFGEMSDSATKIIDTLAEYERPDYRKIEDEKKFRRLEEFLQKVLRDRTLKIQVPSDRKTINFRQHGRTLPLETLGTGVHQAVLLAAAATVGNRRVVCLEEPELHFHPELQRQLMHYLYHETENQYFITTHSAHIMDSVPCSVYGVRMEQGKSLVQVALSRSKRSEICQRLGYRPSDILQANCIIWVEGPSDRIYLKAWIALCDEELEEGWHYSIMFYGGRLLSHLAALDDDRDMEDSDFEEFVQILPINRFPGILIDSDKRSPETPINSTKQRLEEQISRANGYSWISEGREVENYVTLRTRELALKKVYKKFERIAACEGQDNPYVNPLSFFLENGDLRDERFDKVAIARAAVEVGLELDVLDLREKVETLVDFIRTANRIE